jgi:hypothetical protein
MKQAWKWLWLVGLLAAVPAARAQSFGSVLKDLGNHMGQTVEGRLNETTDNAVNKAFDKTDGTVNCAAGDPKCAQSTGQQGSGTTASGATATTAKCVATDVSCLQDAKAHGQTVEIVDEDQIDTMRCSSQDPSCLQRAKKLGKKVEITD